MSQERIIEISVALQKKIPLKYAVKIVFSADSDTCRNNTDHATHTHTIWVDKNTVEDEERAELFLAHELCHSSLAERLDGAFSSVYFDADYAPKIMKMVFVVAILPIDLWVNVERERFFPGIAKREAVMLGKEFRMVSKSMAKSCLAQAEMASILALSLAENARNGHADYQTNRLLALAPNRGMILELANILKKLPALSMDRNEALAQLQKATQACADAMKIGLRLELVSGEKDSRWRVA